MSSEAHSDAPALSDEAQSGPRPNDEASTGAAVDGDAALEAAQVDTAEIGGGEAPALEPEPEPPPEPDAPLVDRIEPTGPSLVDEVMADSGCVVGSERYTDVAAGLSAYLSFMVRTGADGSLIDVASIDLLISELTTKMTRQIDELLHHPKFQQLEAAWRSLEFVVDRVDFRENIRVEMLNVSKQDLLEDFEDAPEIPKSGLYRTVYAAEYGQFGGRPYGLLVANYEFSPLPADMALLDACGSVAAMSHAPFIAGVSPKFFGLDDWLNLPQLSELDALFQGPQYTKWRAFRDAEDSRYVGLCMPRFLLRLPYGPHANRVPAFEYEEQVVGHPQRYLWGNAAFAFATRVADAFARFRWCVNIIGPSTGGTVEDLPLHEYEAMGHIQTKIPTDIVVTERREFEIAEQGFIPFVYRPDTANACFFSAHSCQRPKTYGISEEGRAAALNHRLGTQLPYLFMSCRLAHYLKVLQRENIGTWKERQDLERELQAWINNFVAAQAVVSASIRARRPLREASISVSEVAGTAGWYKVDLRIRPHFRYMGAVFHLGLVGRLDQD